MQQTLNSTKDDNFKDQSVSLHQAALDYAARGIKIFRCLPNSKKPATENGYLDATTDKAQVDKWWRECPNCNIGFEPFSEGLLVVDIDPGADTSGLELPETQTVKTPRGKHLYYEATEPFGSTVGKLAPHVDTRGKGGYVLLPPSVIDGQEYVADDREPAALPEHVARLLRSSAQSVAASNVEVDLPINLTRARTRLNALIASDDVAVSGQGGNSRTYQLACELLELGLSSERAISLVMEPGGWNDHSQPPWSERELKSIFEHAAMYGQNGAGAYAVAPIEDVFNDVDFSDTGPERAKGWSDGLSFAIASDVRSKKINWIWPGRFAAGMVGIVAGSPDTGKSTIAYDIAAKISKGDEWPLGEGVAEQGAVIILSGEDSRARIIVPRLKAAGANLSQVVLLEPLVKSDEHQGRMLNLGDDLTRIAGLIERLRVQGRHVKMIVIDPISAYLGHSDSYKNAEMRALLTPLAEWAEKMQIGILIITHLNKNGNSANALGRITDSLAIAALSRTAWLTAPEKDDAEKETGRIFFMRGKNNISPRDIANLAYRIEGVSVELDDGAITQQPRIVWEGHVNVTADEVLASHHSAAKTHDKVQGLLLTALMDGPVLVSDLRKLATEKGISWRSMERAKKECGVQARKSSFEGQWVWELPEPEAPGDDPTKLEEWERIFQ